MANPDADCATLLAAAGLGLTSGTNLFTGPPRPYTEKADGSVLVPHKAVFVVWAGGTQEPLFGSVTAYDYKQPRVQVFVRGDVGARATALALCLSCVTALHKATPATGLAVLVNNDGPDAEWLDAENSPVFSFNGRLLRID